MSKIVIIIPTADRDILTENVNTVADATAFVNRYIDDNDILDCDFEYHDDQNRVYDFRDDTFVAR